MDLCLNVYQSMCVECVCVCAQVDLATWAGLKQTRQSLVLADQNSKTGQRNWMAGQVYKHLRAHIEVLTDLAVELTGDNRDLTRNCDMDRHGWGDGGTDWHSDSYGHQHRNGNRHRHRGTDRGQQALDQKL